MTQHRACCCDEEPCWHILQLCPQEPSGPPPFIFVPCELLDTDIGDVWKISGVCYEVVGQTAIEPTPIVTGPFDEFHPSCDSCFVPPDEACCFPDGTCLDLQPLICTQSGGEPQGPGTACITTVCDEPTGPCTDCNPTDCPVGYRVITPSMQITGSNDCPCVVPSRTIEFPDDACTAFLFPWPAESQISTCVEATGDNIVFISLSITCLSAEPGAPWQVSLELIRRSAGTQLRGFVNYRKSTTICPIGTYQFFETFEVGGGPGSRRWYDCDTNCAPDSCEIGNFGTVTVEEI